MTKAIATTRLEYKGRLVEAGEQFDLRRPQDFDGRVMRAVDTPAVPGPAKPEPAQAPAPTSLAAPAAVEPPVAAPVEPPAVEAPVEAPAVEAPAAAAPAVVSVPVSPPQRRRSSARVGGQA